MNTRVVPIEAHQPGPQTKHSNPQSRTTSQLGRGMEMLDPTKCFFLNSMDVVSLSSHNHGSVENGCISNISVLSFSVIVPLL